MVSADNLNLDVLEEIFGYIPRGPDLPNIALVSRSFLEAVVPRLYERILVHLGLAKGWPEVGSPFGVILKHTGLAAHVRSVDIFHLPQIRRGNNLIPNPGFIRECRGALLLCTNLVSLRVNVARDSAMFLPLLLVQKEEGKEQEREGGGGFRRLERLGLNANFTREESEALCGVRGVRSLEVVRGSWCVVDVLPRWIREGLGRTLRDLSLYMVTELNEDVLENALAQLPGLRSLHVISCPKADHNVVLRVVRYTPDLENLSFSTSEVNKFSALPPSELSSLRNLTIDSRSPDTPEMLLAVFQYLRTTYFPLVSFKLRAPKKPSAASSSSTSAASSAAAVAAGAGGVVVPFEFVKSFTEVYGGSVRRLSFVGCEVQVRAVEYLCRWCRGLERLDLGLNVREVGLMAQALSNAKNLKTIVDCESHVQHGPRTFLNPGDVELFMDCVPSLRTVVDGNRFWTRQRTYWNPGGDIGLERRPVRKAGMYWFMMQDI